jgi:hypothetical protein
LCGGESSELGEVGTFSTDFGTLAAVGFRTCLRLLPDAVVLPLLSDDSPLILAAFKASAAAAFLAASAPSVLPAVMTALPASSFAGFMLSK